MLTASPLREAVRTFDLQEHAERLDDRERDSAYGLVAMVIGEGNFGKSSLVNSLCGQDVAAVSVVPKTFKIDVYVEGVPGSALVRHLGEKNPRAVTKDEAKAIEAEEESRMKSDGKSTLAEIVWRYSGLTLPKGVALVDTPGISQALAGAAKGTSLTQVLGSTFEVDEVWARWFHRADVVLWGFCANKMESEETRSALEGALKLFDKRIVPIATKGDLIPEERWQEIHQRFYTLYGPLLAGRDVAPLHITVGRSKNPDLHGKGIDVLQKTLAQIAEGSAQVKRSADQAFYQDECRTVSSVLENTASGVVSNLRAIASLGDNLATEAEKEIQRSKSSALTKVSIYLSGIRNSEDLRSAARQIHQETNGGRHGNLESLALEQLNRIVDHGRIQREVNEAFNQGARSLEATAVRLAQTADVARLTFRSSGAIIRQPVPLRLELRALKLSSNLSFPIRMRYPQGFLAKALDFVKGLFGAERFSYNEIHRAMCGALEISDHDFNAPAAKTLKSCFAPAIRDSVDSALGLHLKEIDRDALARLSDVDRHLPALKEPSAAVGITTFGPQGEYWATLSPAIETLLNLAREELHKVIPDFQTLLASQFQYQTPVRIRSRREAWRARTRRAGSISVRVPMVAAIVGAKYRERFDVDGRTRVRLSPFLPHVEDRQSETLDRSALILALDNRLAECVTGVRYESAGSRLSHIGAKAFQAALRNSQREWTKVVTCEKRGPLQFQCGTYLGCGIVALTALPCAFFLPSMLPIPGILGVCWASIGFLGPSWRYRKLHNSGIVEQIQLEIRYSQGDAVRILPKDLVDQVVLGMTAELAPRPLQKLLLDAELLRLP